MSLDSKRLAAASCALLAAGAACSGGGAPPEEPIVVQITPGALVASFAHGENTAQLALDVTLSRVPDSPVHVLVEEPERLLDASSTHVEVHPNGMRAWVYLFPSCALEPGVHDGVLTMSLCRDAACTRRHPLSGNTLPYTFTVSPGVRITAAVDGVPQPGYMTICGAGGLDLRLTSGQTLELAASGPIASWEAAVNGWGCYPSITYRALTETRWAATLRSDDSFAPFSGSECGFVSVGATPVDWPFNQIRVSADVAIP